MLPGGNFYKGQWTFVSKATDKFKIQRKKPLLQLLFHLNHHLLNNHQRIKTNTLKNISHLFIEIHIHKKE